MGWSHYSITTPKHHTLLNNHNPPSQHTHGNPQQNAHLRDEEKILNKTSKCGSRGKLKLSIYKFHGSEIFRSFFKQKGYIVTLGTCLGAEENLLIQERG